MLRLNAEGLAGLADRPCGRRPERLTDGRQAALVAHVLRGPDPGRGEPSIWTLPDPCRFIEARFDKTPCPTPAMSVFPAEFAAIIQPGRPDRHVVMVLDQAGWQRAKALVVPGSITPVPLPPHGPDLDPAERLRLYPRERFLSHRPARRSRRRHGRLPPCLERSRQRARPHPIPHR